MSLIVQNAQIGFDARHAIHAVPNVNTAVENKWTKVIKPNGQISKGSVIEFDIQNNSEHYIDTRAIQLLLQVNILKDDGTPVTDADNVTFINYPAASLIRQVDFCLQQQQISPGVGGNYPYKVMLDILTKSGKLAQVSVLKPGLFEKDLAGVIDSHNPANTANTGLEERFRRTKTGRPIQLQQKLYIDFCECEKELVNNVPINIKIYPSSDRFALLYVTPNNPAADETRFYTVNIIDAVLHVPHVKLHPGILLKNQHDMLLRPAPYVHPESQVKTYNIPPQSYDFVRENIFLDRVPNVLIVVLVSAAAYSGDNQRSPFNFQHYNLSYIDFVVDGCSNEAHRLTPDYPSLNYGGTYLKLFDDFPDIVPDISYDDFMNGYAIYKFNIAPTKATENEIPAQRSGQTSVSMKFSRPLAEAVTAIFYGSFVGGTLIDKVKNVIVPR